MRRLSRPSSRGSCAEQCGPSSRDAGADAVGVGRQVGRPERADLAVAGEPGVGLDRDDGAVEHVDGLAARPVVAALVQRQLDPLGADAGDLHGLILRCPGPTAAGAPPAPSAAAVPRCACRSILQGEPAAAAGGSGSSVRGANSFVQVGGEGFPGSFRHVAREAGRSGSTVLRDVSFVRCGRGSSGSFRRPGGHGRSLGFARSRGNSFVRIAVRGRAGWPAGPSGRGARVRTCAGEVSFVRFRGTG